MNDAAQQWFENHFLLTLGLRRDEIIRTVLQQLIRATANQHSCLQITDPHMLAQLSAHRTIGRPGDAKPLILDHDHLYLARFYEYERDVAEMITARNQAIKDVDDPLLKTGLEREFGAAKDNQQKLAALLALTRQLCIITGGPGTGKTSTVVRILKLELAAQPALRFCLAAPTGKAAMRLRQSISSYGEEIDPEVQTIHRLLGMRRDGRTFKHGPNLVIPTDLLIVDEASMIDLPMMHRLLLALPKKTRLILLGDPNQLPSVETGNVLADLCLGDIGFSNEFAHQVESVVGQVTISKEPSKLTDAVCELTMSYRFAATNGIGRLASAIKKGGATLTTSEDGAVTLKDTYIPDQLIDYWRDYLALLRAREVQVELLLEVFEQTRILCSRRRGTPGVETINGAIESAMEALGLKAKDEDFYPGRPILITRNDYNLGLFNGDIGICVACESDGHFVAHFHGGRQFLVSSLPAHESCFAMTIHKAQGSEFENVVLILAEETPIENEQLLNREILYTAVTRAKSSIIVIGNPAAWGRAMDRSAARKSGMPRFLQLETPRLEKAGMP